MHSTGCLQGRRPKHIYLAWFSPDLIVCTLAGLPTLTCGLYIDPRASCETCSYCMLATNSRQQTATPAMGNTAVDSNPRGKRPCSPLSISTSTPDVRADCRRTDAGDFPVSSARDQPTGRPPKLRRDSNHRQARFPGTRPGTTPTSTLNLACELTLLPTADRRPRQSDRWLANCWCACQDEQSLWLRSGAAVLSLESSSSCR